VTDGDPPEESGPTETDADDTNSANDTDGTADTGTTDDDTEPLADLAAAVGVEATGDDDSLAELVDDTPLGGVDPDTVDTTDSGDVTDRGDVTDPVDATDTPNTASGTDTTADADTAHPAQPLDETPADGSQANRPTDDGTAGPQTDTAATDTTTPVDADGTPDSVDATEVEGTAPDAVGATDATDTEPDDTPLSELADEVAGTEPLDDSPFEEVDTTEFDTTDAWQRLEDDEQFEQPGSGVDAEAVAEPATAAPEHVVDKRQYCQQCPYLSSPPAVSCGHDGTEIVEVTDADHFRVRACPMIGEDGPNFDAVDEE